MSCCWEKQTTGAHTHSHTRKSWVSHYALIVAWTPSTHNYTKPCCFEKATAMSIRTKKMCVCVCVCVAGKWYSNLSKVNPRTSLVIDNVKCILKMYFIIHRTTKQLTPACSRIYVNTHIGSEVDRTDCCWEKQTRDMRRSRVFHYSLIVTWTASIQS